MDLDAALVGWTVWTFDELVETWVDAETIEVEWLLVHNSRNG